MLRPIIKGVPKPLAESDPIEWWQEEAARLGLTVESLKEQIKLADEVIDEIIREEAAERKS